ncbi:MAG: hypothetical protein PW843_29355 [Azospirillaceae bacterium]|nr:hypothetical protein [Azospirillaceae bacterium]
METAVPFSVILERSSQSRLANFAKGLWLMLAPPIGLIVRQLEGKGVASVFDIIMALTVSVLAMAIFWWPLRPDALVLNLDDQGFTLKRGGSIIRRRWLDLTKLEILPRGVGRARRSLLFIGVGSSAAPLDGSSLLLNDDFTMSMPRLEALMRTQRELAYKAKAQASFAAGPIADAASPSGPPLASVATSMSYAPPLEPLVRPTMKWWVVALWLAIPFLFVATIVALLVATSAPMP